MMTAWVSPATAITLLGASGTTGLTANDCHTCAAGRNALLPAWSATMVQVPALMKVSMPPEVTVHTPVLDEVNVTASPEVALTPLPKVNRFGDVP
ncbi:hypothetical protein D3C81_1196960 [compost metagenome]